jgi:hypothetical protein
MDPRQIPQPLEILDDIVMVRRLADGGDTEELNQFSFCHDRRANREFIILGGRND